MKVNNLADIAEVRDYLNRIGAQVMSLQSAAIRESTGKYTLDRVTIRFRESGEVNVYFSDEGEEDESVLPTDEERKAIAEAFKKAEFPKPKLMPRITNPPPQIKNCDKENLYEFRDYETGLIKFVQVRGYDEDGEKHYYPWTYFDDGEWRPCYPEWKLPMFNAEKLKGASTVFIHEGAKAARNVQEMIEAETPSAKERLLNHPWGPDLCDAVHIGWIGGAPNPHRTDWGPLLRAGVRQVYIVADNDLDGRKAVPKIAFHLRVPGFTVQFTDEWPASFDLGDDFPINNPKLFGYIGGELFYKGPSFRETLHPATWATEKVITGKAGRPTFKLRDSFMSQWSYIEEVDMFVCNDMPEIMRGETVLNKMLASFSHVAETSRLMVKEYHGRQAKLAYNPGESGRMVTFKGSSALNLHIPSGIKSKPGDPQPFLEFLDYLFPNERERHEMKRWAATLIARPNVRMGYGILLVSTMQGVGKTTLGSHVLAPLVGYNNVSYPSETDINNQFNGWIAYKRLAIVNEIYSGHSWKAYNSLKTSITDRDVDINQKYMRQFTIENWCHIFACSNSERALRMENDDRRWFYPKVTETVWGKHKFDRFYLWLQSGGLSIVKFWAENFGDYVSPSDRAPMTERKKELIDGSRSEAQQEAAAVAEMLKDLGSPGVLFMKDVVTHVRDRVQGKVFDSDLEIRKSMVDVGLHVFPQRVKVSGRYQYAVFNNEMLNVLNSIEEDAERVEAIRKHSKKPDELGTEEI